MYTHLHERYERRHKQWKRAHEVAKWLFRRSVELVPGSMIVMIAHGDFQSMLMQVHLYIGLNMFVYI